MPLLRRLLSITFRDFGNAAGFPGLAMVRARPTPLPGTPPLWRTGPQPNPCEERTWLAPSLGGRHMTSYTTRVGELRRLSPSNLCIFSNERG